MFKNLSIKKIFNVHDAQFKFTIFVLLFVYVLGLFAFSLVRFRSDDPEQHLDDISLEMRKKYQDFSALVRTGFYIKNFPVFDFVKNNFVIDGSIWFEFNANEIMLETIEKFSFENSSNLHKSTPDIRIYDDKIFAKYNVNFDLKTELDFRRFPLEDHRLSIILTNDFVSPTEMYFDDAAEALSFSISPKAFTPNWKVHTLRAQSGYASLELDQFDKARKTMNPKVVFGINFKKTGIKKIMVIFIPLFAAVFFALFTFLMSLTNFIGKFRLAITSVTALLGYRFVIEQMSPKVGYFTTTDTIYIFLLVFSFVLFMFQLLMARQHALIVSRREAAKKAGEQISEHAVLTTVILEKINSYVYLAVVIIFVTMVTYLIMM